CCAIGVHMMPQSHNEIPCSRRWCDRVLIGDRTDQAWLARRWLCDWELRTVAGRAGRGVREAAGSTARARMTRDQHFLQTEREGVVGRVVTRLAKRSYDYREPDACPTWTCRCKQLYW